MDYLDTYGSEIKKMMTIDQSDGTVKEILQQRVDENVSPYIICKYFDNIVILYCNILKNVIVIL